MFRLNITSQKHGTPHLLLETQEQVDAYLAEVAASAHWGLPEREVTHKAILDESGIELVPELVEILPAEYTIEVISNYVDQEKINAEALAYLAETDWMVIRAMEGGESVPQDIKLARQAARDRIVRA